MRVNAEFITSVAQLDQLPREQWPEIALVGRSNVGKSSMINTLVGKQDLARTSNTPGRTQTLNYYKITPDEGRSKPFYIVDMPGYGFAAVNQRKRADWSKLIEQYLRMRSVVCGIIQLIDMRHPPQPLDHMMSEWLQGNDFNYLVVGTKADKVAKTKVPETLLKIAESLNTDSRDTLAFSAETKLGREKLWQWMVNAVALEGRILNF